MVANNLQNDEWVNLFFLLARQPVLLKRNLNYEGVASVNSCYFLIPHSSFLIPALLLLITSKIRHSGNISWVAIEVNGNGGNNSVFNSRRCAFQVKIV